MTFSCWCAVKQQLSLPLPPRLSGVEVKTAIVSAVPTYGYQNELTEGCFKTRTPTNCWTYGNASNSNMLYLIGSDFCSFISGSDDKDITVHLILHVSFYSFSAVLTIPPPPPTNTKFCSGYRSWIDISIANSWHPNWHQIGRSIWRVMVGIGRSNFGNGTSQNVKCRPHISYMTSVHTICLSCTV